MYSIFHCRTSRIYTRHQASGLRNHRKAKAELVGRSICGPSNWSRSRLPTRCNKIIDSRSIYFWHFMASVLPSLSRNRTNWKLDQCWWLARNLRLFSNFPRQLSSISWNINNKKKNICYSFILHHRRNVAV